MFIVVVFLFSLLAGLGAAFAMHQINPVVMTRRGLRELTGLPVLGVVSLVLSDRQRAAIRSKTLMLASAAAVLLVFFALVVLYNGFGADLAYRITQDWL